MRIIRLFSILAVSGFVLAIPMVWRAVSPTSEPVLDCPIQAAENEANSSLTVAQCGLGKKWEMNEGCWRGVYTRRGNSNVFDAEWTLLDGRRFTAEMVIDIQGNRVVAQRRKATQGGDCNLINGTLGADGLTVTGQMVCDHPSGQASGCFFARITCGDVSSSCSWDGRWRLNGFNGAIMTLRQWGDNVTGEYPAWYNGRVTSGRASQNGGAHTLSGLFTNDYRGGDGGNYLITMSADCNSWNGTWNTRNNSGTWGAVRIR